MNLARLISTVHNQKNSYMNGYLKALGLSHGQAITLKIIHEENCIKQDDLNKRLQIDKSAVTRILKTLEEKGLIVKTRCEDDKRNQHIVLTDEGKNFILLLNKLFYKQQMKCWRELMKTNKNNWKNYY